jgi:hypothetical protein
MQDEIPNLIAGDEVSELLEDLLAFSCEGGEGIEGLLCLAPGAVVEGLHLGGLVGGEAQQGLHLLVDIEGLLAEVALADAIEIAEDFGGELADIGFGLRDGDLEVAGGDVSVVVPGGEEGDCFGDEVDAGALLADELDLELPVVEADGLVCVEGEVQPLSV